MSKGSVTPDPVRCVTARCRTVRYDVGRTAEIPREQFLRSNSRDPREDVANMTR